MRLRFIASLCGVMTLLFVWQVKLARTAEQAPAPRAQAPAGKPDLSGIWLVHEFQPNMYTNGNAPLRPWAEAKFKTANPETNDPRLDCLPHGMPAFMYSVMPIEIIQIPGRVVMHLEDDSLLRQIYTDGSKHPKDPDDSYNGHSIGRWEGDTLVVDTVGLKATTWLDHVGHPHSDALHIVERIRRVNHDSLEDDFTIDDPQAYTKTWTAQQMYDLKPDWKIEENVCEENNKYRTRVPVVPKSGK